LTLPQFASMTTESTATHSRREQHNAPLRGATGALVLVLTHLYQLRVGPEHEKVEQLRRLLVTDPTRRHFIGRFGAGALLLMMEEAGLPLSDLLAGVQTWCEQDHREAVKRAAAAQLQRTTGLKLNATLLGGILTTAVAAISWAWVQEFSSPHSKGSQSSTAKKGTFFPAGQRPTGREGGTKEPSEGSR
jgi:hypothetical protein